MFQDEHIQRRRALYAYIQQTPGKHNLSHVRLSENGLTATGLTLWGGGERKQEQVQVVSCYTTSQASDMVTALKAPLTLTNGNGKLLLQNSCYKCRTGMQVEF